MVRARDEDMLEPILPKHPPTQRSDEAVADVRGVSATLGAWDRGPRPSWDRLVLVGCAVVATLALVVVALRMNSIAQDQRVQTCEIRVYAAQEDDRRELFGAEAREAEQRVADQLAECIGIEREADEDTD